jgi:hypothetical protein
MLKAHVDLSHPPFMDFKSEFGNCEIAVALDQFKCQLCYSNIIRRSSAIDRSNLMLFKLKLQ